MSPKIALVLLICSCVVLGLADSGQQQQPQQYNEIVDDTYSDTTYTDTPEPTPKMAYNEDLDCFG